jgi:hypothetical protein
MTLRGRPVSNLFYRLDPCAWGQGIARARPANHTSARVALKAGLARVAELDSLGEDGLDWIFASPGWTTT